MPEVSRELFAAVRLAAGFSTVPEPEHVPEPVMHDVTENPPPELGGDPQARRHFLGMMPEGRADLWDSALSRLEGSERQFLWSVKEALDILAGRFDAELRRG